MYVLAATYTVIDGLRVGVFRQPFQTLYDGALHCPVVGVAPTLISALHISAIPVVYQSSVRKYTEYLL